MTSISWRALTVAALATATFGTTATAATAPASASAAPAPAVSVSAGAVTPASAEGDQALAWARSQLGLDEYEGYCLQFVADAYASAGVTLLSSDSAVSYWNAHTNTHPGDTNPPAGALVFWGATDSNPYGHVGISEGGDTVISSYEESTYVIHEFSLAARNAAGYPYLGWIDPMS